MAPKTIAEKYKKHELRDQIYLNPSVYCGSSEPITIEAHLYDDNTKTMSRREITYVPALFKCFDEILVNAIDHSTRLKEELASGEKTNIRPVKSIKVNIDKATGTVTVQNDGDGIDVEKHPEHDMYVPELIFGHLLTSTNYDQGEEKTVGGQNGVGSHLHLSLAQGADNPFLYVNHDASHDTIIFIHPVDADDGVADGVIRVTPQYPLTERIHVRINSGHSSPYSGLDPLGTVLDFLTGQKTANNLLCVEQD